MKFLISFLLFLVISVSHAADNARTQMETFSKNLDAISGNFSQQVFDANDQPRDHSEGTLALKAPRQFRWQTTSPFEQLIVADGDHVWIYDPDLEQVTVRNQSFEEAHSPLTVLTDLNQLDREFISMEQGKHDGLTWLRLKSKAKEPEFEYAELGFDAQGLKKMVFKDTLGNRTEITFSDWKRNPKFGKDTFKFTPPKGVDVIGDVKPNAEVFPVQD